MPTTCRRPASTSMASRPACDGKADFNLMYGYIGHKRCNADTSTQGTCLETGEVGAGAAQQHVDMRLGWSAPSGRWSTGLVVTNLLYKQYISISTLGQAVGSPYAYVSKPRMIALELRVQL